MRRALMFGLPTLALLLAAGGAYHYLHHGNLLQDAAQRTARGDLHGAELDLDTYLRGHPDNPEASFRLGAIRLAQGNLVAAERLLRRAKQGGYDPAKIVMPLGETYLQQHRYEELLTDFTLDKSPPAARADTLALRASAFLALNKGDQARQEAAAAVAAAPDAAMPALVAARVDAASHDPKSAEARVDKLLARDPKLAEAGLLKIELLAQRNALPEALKVSQDLLAANPGSPAIEMWQARVLAAMNRDVEAMKLVADVVRRIPHDIGANYLKLRLADRQKNFAEADAALTILLPVIDRLPQGEYFAAITKLGVNQTAQAQEAAAKFVAQNPGDPDGIKLLAFAELALGRGDAVETVIKPLLDSGHPDAETLDLHARALAMRGDLKGAEQALARASSQQPGNEDILNRLGAAKLGLGEIQAGEDDLRRSLAKTPDQPRAASALVQTALASGDVAGAATAVEQLRKAVGDSETVGILDGQVKIAQLDLAGAEAVFGDTVKRFPDSRQATLGLVQVEARLGNTKTAHDRLLGWMNAHPDDKVGLKLLVTGDMAAKDSAGAIAAAEAAHGAAPGDVDITAALATLYLSANMPQKAADLVDRSTNGGAEVNPALLPLKGQALINQNRMTEAEAVLRQAADALPADPRPRFGLIELKMRLKDYDGARELARQALATFPGDPRLLEAAVAVELRAHGIQAALAMAQSLQHDPKNLPVALTLGPNALAVSGDLPGAARAFAAAYHQAPSSAMALAAASALNRAGRAADAMALLREWTASHPDDAGAQSVLAADAIAGHHDAEAESRLGRVLTAHPSDPAALNNMAWARLMTGDSTSALNYAKRAYYISPGAETEDTLGWIMVARGDTAGALPLLQQAVSVKPSQQILYHYAVALNGQGRAREARESLDKALGEKTTFDGRAEAEALRAKLP